VTHVQITDTQNHENPFDGCVITAGGRMEEACMQCLFAQAEFHKDLWIVSFGGPNRDLKELIWLEVLELSLD